MSSDETSEYTRAVNRASHIKQQVMLLNSELAKIEHVIQSSKRHRRESLAGDEQLPS